MLEGSDIAVVKTVGARKRPFPLRIQAVDPIGLLKTLVYVGNADVGVQFLPVFPESVRQHGFVKRNGKITFHSNLNISSGPERVNTVCRKTK